MKFLPLILLAGKWIAVAIVMAGVLFIVLGSVISLDQWSTHHDPYKNSPYIRTLKFPNEN
jgi:hypothetical protein